MEKSNGLNNLFRRFLDDDCSPEEIRDLLNRFNAAENEEALRSLIRQHLALPAEENRDAENLKPLADAAYINIKSAMAAGNRETPVRPMPFFRKKWPRIAAALIVSAAGTWLYYSTRTLGPADSHRTAQVRPTPDSIIPGSDKALLTLADGTTIVLDSTANGELAKQGDAKVVKQANSQLTYNPAHGAGGEVLYNTMRTPRGGRYRVTLSDGSSVWLNAASSIRFPTVFSGRERVVEITGEAYFEVAKDPSRPFRVTAAPAAGGGRMEVEVLGTHFNINTNSNEPGIKTTLLEGAVKIINRQAGQTRTRLLKPGEQAAVGHENDAAVRVTRNVDIDEVMAWKNGYFVFNGRSIKSIMHDISLWYDVDVAYEGPVSAETFSGIVSRNSSIAQVIKIMQDGGVKFKIEGRKITVIQE